MDHLAGGWLQASVNDRVVEVDASPAVAQREAEAVEVTSLHGGEGGLEVAPCFRVRATGVAARAGPLSRLFGVFRRAIAPCFRHEFEAHPPPRLLHLVRNTGGIGPENVVDICEHGRRPSGRLHARLRCLHVISRFERPRSGWSSTRFIPTIAVSWKDSVPTHATGWWTPGQQRGGA